MAGPLSADARVKSLQGDYGPTRSSQAPDSLVAHLYDGHPEFDGVELDTSSCPGYVAPTIDSDNFEAVDGGVQVTVTLADSTGAWTKVGRWVVLENADAAGEFWDYVPVGAVKPTDAGDFDPLVITLFYSDDSTDPS